MPKWSCIVGNVIALLLITRLMIRRLIWLHPCGHEAATAGEGGGVGMPLVQAKVAGQGLRSDVQPRVTRESPNRVDERKKGSADAAHLA